MGRGRKGILSQSTKKLNPIRHKEIAMIVGHPDKSEDALLSSDNRWYFSPKKNKCAWLKVGEHGSCGEPCSDVYCEKHLYMRMIGCIIPLPCLVCGVGVINFEFICTPCRLEKEKRQIGLILAKQFENNEDWHDKTSGINGC